jgi:hypothetical protein
MKQRLLISLMLTFVSILSVAQPRMYYYGINSRPVNNKAEAITYEELIQRSETKYLIKTYQLLQGHWKQVKKEKIALSGDNSQLIKYYADTWFPKKIYREFEQSGPNEYQFKESTSTTLIRTGTTSSYLPLHLEGLLTQYHPNGKIKSKSVYKDNQLISNENWLSDGSKYIDSIFYSVDEEPEYQMGDDFFKSFLIRKLEESKIDLTQIQDEVVLGWVVMKDGTLDGIITTKGKSRQLNEFLVNTIAELPGDWSTAMLDGSPVRFYMTIPLNFMQREANFQEIDLTPGGVMHYNKY